MRPAVSVVAWSVCVLVTTVGSAKTAEPIEIPFGEKGLKEPCTVVIIGVYNGAIWLIRWLNLCDGGAAASCYHYCNNWLFIALNASSMAGEMSRKLTCVVLLH